MNYYRLFVGIIGCLLAVNLINAGEYLISALISPIFLAYAYSAFKKIRK